MTADLPLERMLELDTSDLEAFIASGRDENGKWKIDMELA